MPNVQLQADRAAQKPDPTIVPDDGPKESRLRRSTGKERAHRDRGWARNTNEWAEHVARCRD